MRQLIFLIFTSTFLSVSWGQEIHKTYIDSVMVALSKLERENSRIHLKQLLNRVEALPKDDAIWWYEYIARNVDSPFSEMVVYGEYSTYLVSRDFPEKSIKFDKQGLEISRSLGSTIDEVSFHINLANAYIFQNRADEALYHLNTAEPMAEELGLRDAITSINYSKGMVYESLEDFKEATRRYLEAWEQLNAVPDHPERGFYLYVLVDYFSRIGNISEQTKFTELLAEYYHKRQPETPFTHLPLSTVFDTAVNLENIERYRQVIRVSDSMNALNSLLYSSFALSDIYLKLENPQAAIDVLLPLRESLDSTDRDQQKMSLYGKLSSVAEAGEDFKNALFYKNLEAELRDTLVSEKTRKNIAELEVKYDLQTKERRLEQEASSKKLLYWILGSVFVMLVILSFFLLKNRNKNRKLARQKQLLEVTVDEKNVILKETHHRVKNSFQIVSSLLYLQLENIKDKEARDAIKEAQNRVRSMVLIHQKLYSKEQLVGIDTAEYFVDLAREIFGSHQMEGKQLDYTMDVDSVVLDIESITPIGLILNELITNVLKHAFDEHDVDRFLNIQFHKKDKNLVLKVTDNGMGMPKEFQETSFGIKLMKALAKKIKASLTFENAPKQGTVATLEVSRFKIL